MANLDKSVEGCIVLLLLVGIAYWAATSLPLNYTMALSESQLLVYKLVLNFTTYRYITGSTRTCTALIPMLRGDDVVLAKATFTGSASGDSDVNGAIYFVCCSSVHLTAVL